MCSETLATGGRECQWVMYTDDWCYDEQSHYRYHAETMVYMHVSAQQACCPRYNCPSQCFVLSLL
jgi:hypothetical protein